MENTVKYILIMRMVNTFVITCPLGVGELILLNKSNFHLILFPSPHLQQCVQHQSVWPRPVAAQSCQRVGVSSPPPSSPLRSSRSCKHTSHVTGAKSKSRSSICWSVSVPRRSSQLSLRKINLQLSVKSLTDLNDLNLLSCVCVCVCSRELTPIEQASRLNQKLKANYEARLARLTPGQANQKTSLVSGRMCRRWCPSPLSPFLQRSFKESSMNWKDSIW